MRHRCFRSQCSQVITAEMCCRLLRCDDARRTRKPHFVWVEHLGVHGSVIAIVNDYVVDLRVAWILYGDPLNGVIVLSEDSARKHRLHGAVDGVRHWKARIYRGCGGHYRV